MTVDEALHAEMAANGTITARVGNRIYNGWRPPRTALPCITHVRISTTPMLTSSCDGACNNIRMQVDVWAKRQSEARIIAEAVRTALDGWTRSTVPALTCALISDNDIIEQDDDGGNPEHRITQDYSIWTGA